jgi:hypothetical protein
MSLSNLKPECRILLLSLLDKYPIGQSFCISIEDMAKAFFTTRNVLTDLFTYLKYHGYVAIERKPTIRGRGRYIYTFTNGLAIFIEQDLLLSKAYKSNDLMVQKIIRNELQETTISLRSSHRLFILILVIHADKMGRISGTNSSKIRQMMGSISPDRFKSQMRKLQSFKLLSCYIAGLTSKKLFGKITSTYFINLNHPIFLDWLPEVSSIHIEAKSLRLAGVNQCSEANALIEASKPQGSFYPVLSPIKHLLKMEDIHYFFSNANEHDNLQLRLFDIASVILSEIWKDGDEEKARIKNLGVDKESGHKITDLCDWNKILPKSSYALLKKLVIDSNLLSIKPIERVLSDVNIKADIKSDMSKQYCSLIYTLFLLSLNIADRYKAMFMKIAGDDCHIKEFCIIPKHKINTHCEEYEIRFITTEIKNKRLNLSFSDEELQCENGHIYYLKDEFVKHIQPKYIFHHYSSID